MSHSDNNISQPSLPLNQSKKTVTKSLEKVSVPVPKTKNVASVLNRISNDALNESKKVSLVLKNDTDGKKKQNLKNKVKEDNLKEEKINKDKVKNTDIVIDEKPTKNKKKDQKTNKDQIVSIKKENNPHTNKGLFYLYFKF